MSKINGQPHTYDHRPVSAMPEYWSAQSAIQQLAQALDLQGDDAAWSQAEFIAAITALAAAAHTGDICARCRDTSTQRCEEPPPMRLPLVLEIEDDLLRHRHWCPTCGTTWHTWTPAPPRASACR